MPHLSSLVRAVVWTGACLVVSATGVAAQSTSPLAPTPGAARAMAAASIGSLDFAKLTATSSVAKSALTRVEATSRAKAEELGARAKALEAQRAKLETDAPLLAESARSLAQQAFARAQLAFDRQREDAEAEVNQLRLDVERELRARLFPVVDAVAREKGLQLVLNVSSADFLWVHPDIDISLEVARRLDLLQKTP